MAHLHNFDTHIHSSNTYALVFHNPTILMGGSLPFLVQEVSHFTAELAGWWPHDTQQFHHGTGGMAGGWLCCWELSVAPFTNMD